MVTSDWHRVACIVYFATSNYIYFEENCQSVNGTNTLELLMMREKYGFWSWKHILALVVVLNRR